MSRNNKMKKHTKKTAKHRKTRKTRTTRTNKMTYEPKIIKPTYVEHVSEPWFSLIHLGMKTVEGRKNKGRFKDMQVGEIIEWQNDDFKPRTTLTRITHKATYPTFKEYLEKEGLDNCLPGIPTLEHGLSVYYKYFTEADEKEYGVVAIRMEKI